MDRVRNPFNPGAGIRPPLLVGRQGPIDAVDVAIQRLAIGRFERSVLLKGLRGVGKTVLLNEFGELATGHRWQHAHLEATDDVRIATAMASMSRRVLLEMSMAARSKDRARRALGVLRSFIKVHVPLGEAGTLTIDLDPHPGQADSGQLDSDLSGLFAEVGEAAQQARSGVLFTIDELQHLTTADFSALIVGLHRVSQLNLPLLVVGAGLPSLPGLAGEARSYAERLFTYLDVGPLAGDEARTALVAPVESEGARWHRDAVAQVVAATDGYPYFLQEFGKQAWNLAEGPEITVDDAANAQALAVDLLDQGFFRARIDRATNAERDYLKAMATLGGPGSYKSGDISRKLGRSTAQTAVIRDSLIKRGLCYAPRYGELAFTVPMFDAFIRRAL